MTKRIRRKMLRALLREVKQRSAAQPPVAPTQPTPRTFWNGEACVARRVQVLVGTVERPTWWCAGMEGTIREAVEVTYGTQTFFLDNENGSGWYKVTVGRGYPDVGHSSLPDDSKVIEESEVDHDV